MKTPTQAFAVIDNTVWVRKRLMAHALSGSRPDVVYHYTTAQGLMGILKSRAIWATHIEYLNDTAEFRYARDVAEEAISNTSVTNTSRLTSRLRSCFLQGIREATTRPLAVFVTSFSAFGDSLSQWRGYGAHIGGYAIGFSLAALDALTGHQSQRDDEIYNQQGVFLTPCWYDALEQRQLVNDWFSQMPSLLSSLLTDHDKEVNLRDDDLAVLASNMLGSIAPAFKHPSFVQESEWRLVWDINRRSPQHAAAIAVRVSLTTLIPYIVVPLGDDSTPLQFAEIVIGPTPYPDLARRAIELAAMQAEASVKSIRNSESPFRSL